MTSSIIMTFGDVFNYFDEVFVFLAESVEKKIIYAAKILDPEKSTRLIKFREEVQFKPSFNLESDSLSFVVLKTKDFENCVAWLHNPEQDSERSKKKIARLDDDDLEKIKKEIINGPFPAELREKLKQTT